MVFGPQEATVYYNLRVSSTPVMEGYKLESIYMMSVEPAYVEKS